VEPAPTSDNVGARLFKPLLMKVTFGISDMQKLDPDSARTATITSGCGKTSKLWGAVLGHEKKRMVSSTVRRCYKFAVHKHVTLLS